MARPHPCRWLLLLCAAVAAAGACAADAIREENTEELFLQRDELELDDEFDGFEAAGSHRAVEPAVAARATAPPGEPPPAPPQGPYYLEGCGAALLAIFAIQFLRGRQANTAIADAFWSECCAELFAEQFTLVGFDGSRQLAKESQSMFRCYGSGRRHVKSVVATLHLRERQDLFSLALCRFRPAGAAATDTVTLTVEMQDDAMLPFVFAACKPLGVRALQQRHGDVGHYTKKPVKVQLLQQTLCVLTEFSELTAHFLSPDVAKTISEHLEWFRLMQFSDQSPTGNPDDPTVQADGTPLLADPAEAHTTLRFEFVLPPADRMAELAPLVRLAVGRLIDVAAAARLSKEAR